MPCFNETIYDVDPKVKPDFDVLFGIFKCTFTIC